MKAYKIILIICLFLALLLISCREKAEEITQPTVNAGSQEASDTTITQVFKLPVEMPKKPVIVFSSDRTGDSELYYMSIDGGNVVQVTSSENANYHPRFSPDGSKLVFASTRDSDYSEIYLMDVDGTDVARLTKNEVSDDDPYFSPDGSKIFYTSVAAEEENQTGPPKSSIYRINIDGSNQVIVKDDPNGNYSDYDPIISPDGLKLLFSSPRTYDDEIYIMDIEGSLPTNLTNTEGWDGRPSFSPDGSKIVFSSGRKGNGETADIYIMNSDGTDVKRLTNSLTWNTDPYFSPDGLKIAFSSKKDDIADIFVMDANGKNVVQLTKNAGTNYYPRFSSE
ncbi:MAG: DPP IV N-terminal domain-containing protein [Candidatus Humimicrobiaceae bacterium]